MRRLPVPAVLLLAVAAAAQSPAAAVEPLADAVVRALAPAADDPDATARELVDAAIAGRASPAAAWLVSEAARLVGSLQRPAELHARLLAPDVAATADLVAARGAELRHRLSRALPFGGAASPSGAAAADAFAGHVRTVLAAGPFGDAGDHFVPVPFAPEFVFPAAGTELPGRGTTATVRVVERPADRRRIELSRPSLPLGGCWYARHRVEFAADANAFLEVECDGDFVVFVDGKEQLRVEHWRQPAPARHWLPLRVPAGVHAVVVKTGSIENRDVALRWVDQRGGTLGLAQELPPEGPGAPAGAEAARADGAFATDLDAMLAAAARDGAPANVRIAAMLCAARANARDAALELLEDLRRRPPQSPEATLAFAQVVPLVELPDELRAAEARSLEERAIPELLPAHHHARIVQARLLGQQDQREQALRLLEAHPAPGPETFAARHAILRRLRFAGDEGLLLRRWRDACPGDPRPLLLLAEEARQAGDQRTAFGLLCGALERRSDHEDVLSRAFRQALDLGELDAAARLLDERHPVPAGREPDVERLFGELLLARARGDAGAARAVLARIAAHPDATTRQLEQAAERSLESGDRDTALACLRQSLRVQADQPRTRAWLAQLGEAPPPRAALHAFRRDGDAARAAFQPGEREAGASSTLVIDHRLVEIHADGSWSAEVHELRRINDLAGVEAFRTASAPASAEAVMFVRTIAPDGQVYVPAKVKNEYTLPRLEPGSWIEWRYVESGSAPGADALQLGRFFFRSADEPFVTSELVVVAAPDARGAMRMRGFAAPTRTESLPDGRTAQVWTQQDVPRLPQERWLPPVADLVPVVQWGEDATPFAALRELQVQVWQRTRPTPVVATFARSVLADSADDSARAAAAYAWCQREIEDGEPESGTQALLRKKGSRFLAFVALLRAANVPVATVAVVPRPELGDGDDGLFAPADPFGSPAALVEPAGGAAAYVFFDAPRHWPLGAVPADRAGAFAWVLRDRGTEAVRLPGSPGASQAMHASGTATVADTEVRLEATLTIGDARGFDLVEQVRELKEDVRKLAARQIAQQIFSGWRVQDARIDTHPVGRPMQLHVVLTKAAVQKDGDRWLLPLPLPAQQFVAGFGDRAERTLPLRLDTDLSGDWTIDIEPGAGRRFAEVPPPVAVAMGPLQFELRYERRGDALRVHRTTRLGPGTLPVARFGEWMQALTTADRAERTNLVLQAR